MPIAASLMLMLAPVAGSVADLGWLSGAWVEQRPDGSWTEEYWTPPRGELMIGAGLTGRGDTVRHFEHMRIFKLPDGTVAFVAMPNGDSGVRFMLMRQSADEIVFENPAHDYPQRVTYRRDGNRVIATTSRMDGSKPNRWSYQRP
jgi:hypothetical protein